MVRRSAFLEGPAEEIGHIVLDAHGGEYDGKVFVRLRVSQGSLAHDLGRQLIVGKAVPGEDRQLLAADQGGQAINGGYPGADIVPGVFTRCV